LRGASCLSAALNACCRAGDAHRGRGSGGSRTERRRFLSAGRTFTERGKNPIVANVAVARELSGWCWSLATMQ